MDVSRILTAERGAIEREIMEFFRNERAASLSDPMVHHAVDSLEEFTMRQAKRVRSILAVMGYRAVGGKDIEKARKAAVALELVQSMLLIHDDIIDRSHTRRGKPSLHVHFSGLHSEKGYKGDAHGFGTNLAIIVGDLAESFGEKALLGAGFPPDRSLDALKHQTDMIRDTGYGQILDLYSVELPEWSEEQVMKVHAYKTARYTFDGPLRIGASLHGGDRDQLEALSGYALPVGVAFQLVDDIVGFFGDPRRGGKMDMSDIREGKRTLLIIKALENGDDGQRQRIDRALGNPDLTLEQAEEVRDIVRGTGSEIYSRELARLRTEEGIKALEGADLEGEVVVFLGGFARSLMERA